MFLTAKYNKIILSGLLLVLSFLMVAQIGSAETPAESKAKNYGLDATAEKGMGISKTAIDSSSLPAIIGKIIGTGLAFLGVIFFVLILYAGLTWILSMGKEEKINQAKDMIMAAVLGLIVVLGAYAITNLIAKIFTEAVPK